MSTMCQSCGSKQTTPGSECKFFHEQRDSSCSLNDGYPPGHCKACLEQCGKEALQMNGSSPYFSPPLSPISSCETCSSSFGDTKAGLNLQCRENEFGALDAAEKQRNMDNKSYVKASIDGSRPHISNEKKLSSSSLDSNEEENKFSDEILDDAQPKTVDSDSCRVEEPDINDILQLLPDFEADPHIWLPPEPEDTEDSISSIADNDEDDEYSCIEWNQPSTLRSLDEHQWFSHNYREKRQKAMLEALNGQLKILVSHFLASEGIPSSVIEDGQSWLDIVASLSWKAALLVKPDATEGRAMDPGSYVKVKCVASGSRHESELIKGLVFKKNAAHKHMPTKFKNPKLLLLQGVLGHSAVRLSSFNSMEQEKEHLKSIIHMIEACSPNVVLVEKNISRDIQESLIEKRITVVSDMKLQRLQRVSLCTGSPIISCANLPTKLILPQCDLFHIEKFMEEYSNTIEGGKRPSKTLMFLEGFQKPLGCTILLRGAQSDELKKIKRVVQYTVFAAYHLILETSFHADLRVFLFNENDVRTKPLPLISSDAAGYSDSHEGFLSTLVSENTQDVPVCNGSLGRFNHTVSSLNSEREFMSSDKPSSADMLMLDSMVSLQPPLLLSPRSASHEKFQGDSFTSLISESVSLDFISNNKAFDGQCVDLNASSDTSDHENETNSTTGEEKLDDEIFDCVETGPVRDLTETVDVDDHCNTVKREHKDDAESVLYPQSILVLLSKQCMKKGTLCEQSHLSRIKYYGYFDISLGRFLRDIFLGQNSCSSCGEPPDGHMYSYTHQNGNLSVNIRQLPPGSHLSGEAEGKIWMWNRCLRCKNGSDIPRKRVLLSSSAGSLSFGKLLELSFSGHSATSRLSECGHSLHRDFLRFFGLGSKVTMFVYSPVKIYTACKPPPLLEFHNPKEQGWLKREVETVLFRGRAFFSGVSGLLQNLKPIYYGPLAKRCTELSGSLKQFSEVEEILTKEKDEFEASLLEAIDHSGQMEITPHQILGLKWLSQELLLELYVWDRRLDCLLQHTKFQQGNDSLANHEEIPKVLCHDDEPRSSSGDHHAQGTEEHAASLLEQDPHLSPDPPSTREGNQICQEGCVPIPGEMHVDNRLCIAEEPYIGKETVPELNQAEPVAGSEMPATSFPSKYPSILDDIYTKPEGPEEFIWTSFSDLRKEYRKDLNGGSLQKFEFIQTYSPSHLSPICHPCSEEMDSLHFTVGHDGNVLSASEDEISSIIACALAISEDRHGLLNRVENGSGKLHGSYGLTSDNGSGTSVCCSSIRSSESEGITLSLSASSLSSDYSSTSSSDVLLPSENLHPEVPLGIQKVSGRNILSVVCIYAKQFYNLRKKCCPSELAYISSLSRCKKWDAQGGKSKAFFVKSLDERFIIKQIKKTEFDSFLKFGPDYFKHVFHSLDTGSQTCLSKILGIYQVRQCKSGKEVKTDLMVMENLLYGHKISRTYDLKGAVFARYIPDAKYSEKVLLDQNFVEDMHKSPIYVGGNTKLLLQRAIWNDTSFLTSINVMDYSLLVGVDDERQELVFGIIDYLRQYTWDKQLETWVKASIVVPKNELPTIISPKEYKKRFRKFMARYFLSVPHSWNCKLCSQSCIFCTDGTRTSAKAHHVELSEGNHDMISS